MTFSITILSKMIFSITILSIMTFSNVGFLATLSITITIAAC